MEMSLIQKAWRSTGVRRGMWRRYIIGICVAQAAQESHVRMRDGACKCQGVMHVVVDWDMLETDVSMMKHCASFLEIHTF
jgi:hypothetical protein